MMSYLYAFAFFVPIVCVILVARNNYKTVEWYYWVTSIVVVLINWGYFTISISTNVEAMLSVNRMVQLEGTFLLVILIMSVVKKYMIKLPMWARLIAYFIALVLWSLAGYGARNGLYYTSYECVIGPYGSLLMTEAGILKDILNCFVGLCMVVILVLIGYGFMHRHKTSYKSTIAFLFMALLAGTSYGLHMVIDFPYEFQPFVYAIGVLFLAVTYDRNICYDVESVVAINSADARKTGYIVFDNQKHFLAANEYAHEYMPSLNKLIVDMGIEDRDVKNLETVGVWLDQYDDGNNEPIVYKSGNNSFRCIVTKFRIKPGKPPKGYLIELSEDNAQQERVEFIRKYNEILNEEVDKKTKAIARMQERVVLGLADLIENRDSNTGGHVKRTSDIVRILVKHMREEGTYGISEEFGNNVIRSAPMHDLGKVAIDNSILNKPGKLTDEEYAIMKTHSAKSGEIVKNMLRDVEESQFVEMAYGLARYHHERWDGRGYPDGLSGENIPLEARIMTIADVYDALVSKRVYKEPMSFEKANAIMLDSMGSQFDPNLQSIYEKSRKEFEEYYAIANKE